jgi:hypothetical protein
MKVKVIFFLLPSLYQFFFPWDCQIDIHSLSLSQTNGT